MSHRVVSLHAIFAKNQGFLLRPSISMLSVILGLCCWGAIIEHAHAQLISPNLFGTGSGFPEDWYLADSEELKDLRSLEGQPAPEISVAQWRGDSTSLSQLKGKVVVLDFWATWCGPCMAAIPKNVALVDKFKDKGVMLIGMHDAKSGWDSVDQVISEKSINYPVALDQTEGDSGASTKAYKLMFWPTYVVIDRTGTVRAIGLKPDKVEQVVERLLEEAAPTGQTVQALSSVPDLWFLGGANRLASMRSLEGERAPSLAVAGWANGEPDRGSWKGQIKVIQFVRPEVSVSVMQLAKLQNTAERFAKQGVAFVAVCDARSQMDQVQSMIDENRIELPVALDSPTEDLSPGLSATALGVKFSPSTVVIDRRGVVRASGLKTDFLDRILNTLLSEPMPAAAEMADDLTVNTVASDTVASDTVASDTVASDTVASTVEIEANVATEQATPAQEEAESPPVPETIPMTATGSSAVVQQVAPEQSLRAELPEDAAPPSPLDR